MPLRKINSRYEGSDVLRFVLEVDAAEGGRGIDCDMERPRNSNGGVGALEQRVGADEGRRILGRVVDGSDGGTVLGRVGSEISESQ